MGKVKSGMLLLLMLLVLFSAGSPLSYALETGYIETYAGGLGVTGRADNTAQQPMAGVLSGGSLYVSDNIAKAVRRIDLTTQEETIFAAGFNKPRGLAADQQGNLYVADAGDNTVYKLAADGTKAQVQGASGLGSPESIAVDATGNLFIADTQRSRVLKIDTAGVVTTAAGTGVNGYTGDGGSALQARLSAPRSIAVDGSGNLYIADFNNHRVRKVDKNGIITTLAGTGVAGAAADGVQAGQAALSFPWGLAADGTSLYISELGNHRVLRIDLAQGQLTAIAGDGTADYSGDGAQAKTARLNGPRGLAADAGGNLYIMDSYNYRVRKVDAGTGVIATVAGTGKPYFGGGGSAASNASLYFPEGLAVDSAGNLYIADTGNNRVRKVDAASKAITTVAGTGTRDYSGDGGPALEAALNAPRGVAVDGSGNLYIADTGNNRIRKVDAASGTISTVAGSGVPGFAGDGGQAVDARLNYPRGVAVNDAGLYIADTANYRVRMVDALGGIRTVAGNGGSIAPASGKSKLPVSADATNTSLSTPYQLSLDAEGNLYIAGPEAMTVLKLTLDGKLSWVIGTNEGGGQQTKYPGDAATFKLIGPFAAVPDDNGNLFVADTYAHLVRKLGSDKKVNGVAGYFPASSLTSIGGFSGDTAEQAVNAKLYLPAGIALDKARGLLYISDTGNHRIRVVKLP